MRSVINGDLSAVSLPSLLQLAEAEALTGWLRLKPGGELGLYQGRIVHARSGSAEGIIALRQLFFADRGTFSLDADNVAQGPVLGDIITIILDGCRLVDEWTRLAPMFLAVRTGAETKDLEAPITVVLERLDGQRTVSEATLEAHIHPAQIVDPLLELLDKAELVRTAAPDPQRVRDFQKQAPVELNPPSKKGIPAANEVRNTEPASFHDLLDQGRHFLRKREFSEAETVLSAALALRPDDRIVLQNLRRLKQLQSKQDSQSPYSWFRR